MGLEVSKSESRRLTVRFSRLLNKINPQRIKRAYVDDDNLVAAYAAFRARFLTREGRLPTYREINKAQKDGTFISSFRVLAKRFGNGSWPAAREKLEELIKEISPSPVLEDA